MERKTGASRSPSNGGGRATNKLLPNGAPVTTRSRRRGNGAKPGGGMWLLKWAIVAILVVVLLLLILPGLGLGLGLG